MTDTTDTALDAPSPTWRTAFMQSPGPRSWLAALLLFFKGALMGAADIVPGVSGGTIAFITGIYSDFINAIASFDTRFVRSFFCGAWRRALAGVHFRFLACLISGIGLAIVTLSGVIQHCMEVYPVPTWSLFFGLIVGSIVIVFREIQQWTVRRGILLALGAAGAWWLCGLIPVNTPETLWFYFLCGVIGICAMALPGISGSFLLLVLGKYYNIVAAIHTLKNAFKAAVGGDTAAITALICTPEMNPLWMLIIFALGQICGIIFFSRFLKWLLARWRMATMGVLAGMMLGALRKIWPWKQQVLVDKFIEGGTEKLKVIEEALVSPGTFAAPYIQTVVEKSPNAADVIREVTVPAGDAQLLTAAALMLTGIGIVITIEFLAKGKNAQKG